MTLDVSKISTSDLNNYRPGVEKQEAKKEKPSIFLEHSTYAEMMKEKFSMGKTDTIAISILPQGAIMGGVTYLIEHQRENKDFKKIESGELEGKQVFIDKKAYKAAKKSDPENAKNMVLLKSAKAKTYVRDNAETLGLDVRGEFKSNTEIAEEKSAVAQEYREARIAAKQALKEAKMKATQELKEAKMKAKQEREAEVARAKVAAQQAMDDARAIAEQKYNEI